MRINWTITATAIAVFALLHQVASSLFDLNPKALQLRVDSISTLVSASQPKLGIEITRRGAALVQPTLAVLELSNSGGKPVLAGDFESKFEISAGTAVIAAVNLDQVEPSDLQPTVAVIEKRVILEPLLLNPGDKVRLLVLTEGSAPEFRATARIAGIRQVEVIQPQERAPDSERLKVLFITGGLGPLSLLLLMATARKLEGNSRLKASIVSGGTLALTASFASTLQAVALMPPEWRQLARWSAIGFTVSLLFFAILATFRYAKEDLSTRRL